MKDDLWRRPLGAMVVSTLMGAVSPLTLAGPVEPPPLPPGSAQVRPVPGADPVEMKRSVRAHRHGGHHKRDYTRDDSLDSDASDSNGRGAGDASPKPGKK